MIKIETKINKLVQKQNRLNTLKYNTSIQELLTQYQTSVQKMVGNWKTNKYKVTQDDILEVISDKTNIPICDLKKQDFEKIKNLKKKLESEIFGQNSQIDQIYKCLIRAKAGFRNANKPICSMLFAGPTGVGKTLTAKLLAENLFVNKNNFTVIDMSEYTDKMAVNKLIGSSPGYIGFDKGGVLTEKIRKNPYSLVLFDEIQKADEDVLYMLLQILEEGKISDSSGKIVDFSNTIIVMTTNVGSEVVTSNHMGFGIQSGSIKNDIVSAIKKFFPADLLNRIDEIVAFQGLHDDQIKAIINKELESFKKELSEKNIESEIKEEVCNFIFKKIQFNNFGARQVIKTIQREIQTLVAEKILEDQKLCKIEICVKDNNICVI